MGKNILLSKMNALDQKVLSIEVLNELKCLKKEYPNLNKWYHEVVIPGVLNKEREILVIKDSENIAGIVILKKYQEKKICTLRVSENYRKKGIGKILFEKSFKILEERHPPYYCFGIQGF